MKTAYPIWMRTEGLGMNNVCRLTAAPLSFPRRRESSVCKVRRFLKRLDSRLRGNDGLRGKATGLVLLLAIAGMAGCPFSQPVLSVSPGALSFNADRLSAKVSVSNEGSGTLTWSIESQPDWLAISTSGSSITVDSTMVDVQAILAGLAPGPYQGQIRIRSNGGNRGIAVSVLVVATPVLEVAPATLDFGGSEETATFSIRNAGAGALSWKIGTLPSGFSVSEMAGSVEGNATKSIVVTLNRGGLAPGTQLNGSIPIESNGGSQSVSVSARVQALTVKPTLLDFGGQLEQLSFTLQNTGGTSLQWSINSGQMPAWATLTPNTPSGTIASLAAQTIQVTLNRTGLASGTATGEIRITSDSGDEIVRLKAEGPKPVLVAEPTTIDFGESDASAIFEIRNDGTGTLDWTIQEGSGAATAWTQGDLPWLAVDVTSGKTDSGQKNTITLQVDRTKVAANAKAPYVGTLRVSSTGGGEAFVTLSMFALPPTLQVLPVKLAFETTRVNRKLAIWNGGLGSIAWQISAQDKPAWAAFTPAQGTVSGETADSVSVTVDRTGILPADQDYVWNMQVTGQDGTGAAVAGVSVAVSMNVARTAAISIDTGNVDDTGIAFVPFGSTENSATFMIGNQGTASLSWSIDTTRSQLLTDPTRLPDWVTSIEPTQGSLAVLKAVMITVKVDRKGLFSGDARFTLNIISNDPAHPTVPVRLEMQVPLRPLITVKTPTIDLGLYGVSESFRVFDDGPPGSILNFQISSDKPWLYFFPETGTSTLGPVDINNDVAISVNRSQLEGTGGSGVLTITAFETDETGKRVVLEDVAPAKVTVTVQAAPLTFEAAPARMRIPSLVRFIVLMRDIAYQALPLTQEMMNNVIDGFALFESGIALERLETSQFLTSANRLKTDVIVLLDYSGSMWDAAKSVSDDTIAKASDPLQVLYNKCVASLISELPATYTIGLMEFHERGQPSRRVLGSDGGGFFTRNKSLLLARLNSIAITDHGATELLPAVEDATSELALGPTGENLIPFDDADVRAIICITDGRLTTPPGAINTTQGLLSDAKVRFFPIGWGNAVLHQPLAQISSGTGGHYYPCTMQDTMRDGQSVALPDANALYGWCNTSLTDSCDQSVAKDFQSQVVLSYVTLSEDVGVTVRVDATFDDPNDGQACLPEQGVITGTLGQDLQFFGITGDVRLGQISLRSDEIRNGRAGLVVHADYMPRNITSLGFTITSPQAFTVTKAADADGGIVEGWTLTAGSEGKYTLGSGQPLQYGAFGDLLNLDFSGIPANVQSFDVAFQVTNPVYDANNPEGKYFTFPDGITLSAASSFAPAFPTQRVVWHDDTSTFDVMNVGGSNVQAGVQLVWQVWGKPPFIAAISLESGAVASTTAVQTAKVTYYDTPYSGQTTGNITLKFTAGTVSTAPIFWDLPVSLKAK